MGHTEETDSYEFTIEAEKDRPVKFPALPNGRPRNHGSISGKRSFFSLKASRPALGVNQPLMIGVLRVKRLRLETYHSSTI
jgi:hypothetical protein